MPRVLFVHHRPQASGSARSLALLIGALDSSWEAHVVVPDGAAAALFERSGARVHRGPVPSFTHTWDVQYHGLRWLVALREALWIPGHMLRLRRVLSEVRPDVVHVNDVVILWSAIIAARAGYPVVWHLRCSLPNGGRDRRSHWITRIIDRHARVAIAIDTDVASTFDLHIPLEVIHNPVDVQDGSPADLGVPPGRVTIGLFGYLRRQKGWPDFLAALRILVDRGLPVHGVVVGGAVRGEEAFRGLRGKLLEAAGVVNEDRDFSAEVTRLQLDDHVTTLEFVDDPGGVMRALDVVVFPNRGAGLGRPVLEAAAYGKPVVASGSENGGGVLDPEVTGLLVRPGRPQALADALAELVTNDGLRMRLGAAAAGKARTSAPAETAHSIQTVWRAQFKR